MSYVTSVVHQLEFHFIIHQLPEYLQTHRKKWVENSNEKETVMINNNAYHELKQSFLLPQQFTTQVLSINPIPLDQLHTTHQQCQADQQSNNDEVDSWQVKTLLDHYHIQQSAIQYTYYL